MKLLPEHIIEIKNRFSSIETVGQFSALLQWIYNVKFPNRDPKLKMEIDPRVLTYYAFKKQNRYVHFAIPKKNKGETRPISAPTYKLKTIQKCINEVLNTVFVPHPNSFGFIPKRSVVDNARLHTGRNFVYNIDIDSFFGSTEFRRVKTVLGMKPFNLVDKREPLAFLIANLCCEKSMITRDGKTFEISALPQGAPTSPTLTNIVCQRLDRRLSRLAKRYGASYSRYADDITFSAHNNIFDKWFKSRLKVIIERQENYKIKLEKERLLDWNKRQEVTGIIVNKKANVNRTYIKDVRFWMNSWEKKGTELTQDVFVKYFPDKKGFLRYEGNIITFQNYLHGKILYLGMVRGQEDRIFRDLITRYWTQSGSSNLEEKGIDLYQLLHLWEKKGIDAAIKRYNKLKDNNGKSQS